MQCGFYPTRKGAVELDIEISPDESTIFERRQNSIMFLLCFLNSNPTLDAHVKQKSPAEQTDWAFLLAPSSQRVGIH